MRKRESQWSIFPVYVLLIGTCFGFIIYSNYDSNQHVASSNNGQTYSNNVILADVVPTNPEIIAGGKWIAPSWTDTLKNPLAKIVKATKEGKSIFNSQCYVCHGTYGKGDGIAAPTLNPKPADLTSPEVQKQSDGAIFWKITTGNSPMASYKSTYSENQRWGLVNYIRELGNHK